MSMFRNLLIAQSQSLPYRRRLAYLESTGTQYIDTGVIPNSATKIEIELSEAWDGTHAVGTSSACFFGAEKDISGGFEDTYTALFVPDSGKTLGFRFGASNKYGRWAAFTSLKVEGGVLSLDGVAKITAEAETFTSPWSCALFARKRSATGFDLPAICKMARCKIWQDGVNLTRDFVPVIDLDGKPKMFDLVTKQYPTHYGNFLYGEL